jgi:hypothetical protein
MKKFYFILAPILKLYYNGGCGAMGFGCEKHAYTYPLATDRKRSEKGDN